MSRSNFQKYGHPGKYVSVTTWTGGQIDFTGSGDFKGGVLIAGVEGDYTDTDAITLTGGGTVPIKFLATPASGNGAGARTIHELSISKISGSANTDDPVYIFTKNRLIP
jgi:hypothetical protein